MTPANSPPKPAISAVQANQHRDTASLSLLSAVLTDDDKSPITKLLDAQPAYVRRELKRWLLQRKNFDVSSYTNISQSLRTVLNDAAPVLPLKIVRRVQSGKDRTQKFLLQTLDGQHIEAVLIDNSSNTNTSRSPAQAQSQAVPYTLCLSSQIGCPLSCDFCATGTMRFARNLNAS